MMMSQFKNDIEAYLKNTGTAASTFGREVLNDPGFVYRLRAGGECRPSTIERVREKMAEATKEGS